MLRNLAIQSIVQFLKFYHQTKISPNILRIKGKKFFLSPKVFAPTELITTSQFFVDRLNINEGDKVLDLGTGSGILAIFCADKAKKVLATDINPYAIKLAKKNVETNQITNIELRLSDLFDSINEKFDLILFNPPYFPIRYNPKDVIEVALCCGKNYELIKRFAEEAKNYLKPNGKIQILFSNLADLKLIQSIFIEHGYSLRKIAERDLLIEKFIIYLLIVRHD